MNIETFALWKFKEFEGKLKGFHSSDVFVTKIEKGLDCYTLNYDIKTSRAKITNVFDPENPNECSFAELAETLKKMGLYEERPETERHSSSFVPLHVTL